MAGGLQVWHKEVGVRRGDSPNYSIDLEGTESTRWLQVQWSDVETALWQLVGTAQKVSSGLSRYLPDKHPKVKGIWCCGATECTGQATDGFEIGTEGGDKINKYKFALIKARYGFRPYAVLEDNDIDTEYERYMEFLPHSDTDHVTPRGAQFKLYWSNPGDLTTSEFITNAIVGRLDPYEHVRLRWHQVPDEAVPDDVDLIGRLNQNDITHTDAKRTFPAGTLLYLSRDLTPLMMPGNGKLGWTVDMRFRFYPFGGNKLLDFRSIPTTYTRVSRDGHEYPAGSVPPGKSLYDEAPLENLWAPP